MRKLPLSLLVAGAAALSLELVAAPYGDAFVPNDPLFQYQWHLASSSNYGTNLAGVWAQGITGRGVVIGIIDDGVEGTHPDLAANFREDLSKNFTSDSLQSDDNHGTSVAGVAAGVGRNGIGITGAAPGAEIADLRFLGTNGDAAGAFLWQSGVSLSGQYLEEAAISVKNNSWGPTAAFIGWADGGSVVDGIYDKNVDAYQMLELSALNNVVSVFAAGNERGYIEEQVALSYFNGSDLVVSVAALGQNGKYASYSNFGSGIFVTAPSNSSGFNGITTTDRTGDLGYNPGESDGAGNYSDTDYTNDFGGTSSAAPLVSGIIALAKEVTPAMDVRLAKHALANSSVIVDAGDTSVSSGGRGWVRNSAGYSFNPNYGFGLIDAAAFVQQVVDSAYVTDRTVATSGVVSVAEAVGANGRLEKQFVIGDSAFNQSIESVEARVKVTTAVESLEWKDLHIDLTSAAGTVADLLQYTDGVDIWTDGYWMNGFDWLFTANNFWGEVAAGTWTLGIDNRGSTAVTWNEFEVTINMGEMVLESGNIVLNTDVKALSLNLDRASTYVKVDVARTLTVTDSITINGGTLDVYGTVAEGSPNADAAFFKGIQVGIGSQGKITVQNGASMEASRGLIVAGGVLTNKGNVDITAGGLVMYGGAVVNEGTLGILGDVEIAGGGVFSSNKNFSIDQALSVAGGSVLINTGTEASPTGQLTVAGKIDLVAGNIVAADKISSGDVITVGQGYVQTKELASSGTIEFNGGSLLVGSKISAMETSLNGGTFFPGGHGGDLVELSVAGDLLMGSDAVVIYDLKQVGSNVEGDKIVSTGDVVLGGTLAVNLTNEITNVSVGDTLVLLETTGSVSGIFDRNYAAVRPTLYYDVAVTGGNKEVVGTVTRDYNLPGIALTPNQRAVGEVVNGLLHGGEVSGAFDYENEIYARLDALPTVEALGKAYTTLMPVNAMTVGEDMVRQMRAQSGAMRSRAGEARRGSLQPGSVFTNFLFGDSYGFNYAAHPLVASTGYGYVPFDGPDVTERFTVWVNGGGSYAKGRDTATNPGYDAYGYNGTIGFDYLFSPQALVGVLVGYSNTQSDSNLSGTENDNDSILGAVYAAGSNEGFFYSGMVGYGVDGYSFKRRADLGGGATSDYQAKPDGNSWMGYLEVGYEWCPEDWTFGPTLALQYIRGEIDGYTESGSGAFGLTVDEQTFDSLTSTLGWRVGKIVHWESMTLLPEVRVGWVHEFKNSSRDITSMMSVPGAGKFTVKGANPTNNYANLGAGMTMALSPSATMSVNYDCYVLLNDASPSHQASATFRMSF